MSIQDKLADFRGKREEARNEAQAIVGDGTAADLTEEQLTRLEELEQLDDFYGNQIAGFERIERMQSSGDNSEGNGRRSKPIAQSQKQLPTDRKAGFSHFGEFSQALSTAAQPGAQLDQRLAQMAPSTWSNEGSGGDGGYLVPPEFSARVMEYIGDQNSLYARCDKTPVNHGLYWPVDEDSPWSTSGPQAYWEGEADQYTQSKVNLRTAGFRLNKLVALCPVSDELLEDAGQLEAYLRSTISKKMRWKIDFAILQGTGAGMPLGILNAPCLKSVAKEGSQTADTVNSTNIFKMWSALYGDYRGNATWVYNQDVEVDLLTMVVAGTSSDVPVWLPAGSPYSNVANAPNGTIFGRPAVPHQACETIGDHGDIMFCDFSQYIIGQKTAGPRFDVSMHLFFDYGLQAFRATWRVAGMPKWSTTISARDGSATYSPFVSLAARA